METTTYCVNVRLATANKMIAARIALCTTRRAALSSRWSRTFGFFVQPMSIEALMPWSRDLPPARRARKSRSRPRDRRPRLSRTRGEEMCEGLCRDGPERPARTPNAASSMPLPKYPCSTGRAEEKNNAKHKICSKSGRNGPKVQKSWKYH
jgi:hypothetical protein